MNKYLLSIVFLSLLLPGCYWSADYQDEFSPFIEDVTVTLNGASSVTFSATYREPVSSVEIIGAGFLFDTITPSVVYSMDVRYDGPVVPSRFTCTTSQGFDFTSRYWVRPYIETSTGFVLGPTGTFSFADVIETQPELR